MCSSLIRQRTNYKVWPCPNNLFDTLLPQAVTEPVVHYYPRASYSFNQIGFNNYFFRNGLHKKMHKGHSEYDLEKKNSTQLGAQVNSKTLDHHLCPPSNCWGPPAPKKTSSLPSFCLLFFQLGQHLTLTRGWSWRVHIVRCWPGQNARMRLARHRRPRQPGVRSTRHDEVDAVSHQSYQYIGPKPTAIITEMRVWCTVFRAALEGLSYRVFFFTGPP